MNQQLLTQLNNNHYLLLACKSLFDSTDPNYIIHLLNNPNLIQPTMITIQESKQYLSANLTYYQRNQLHDLIETIVLQHEKQLLQKNTTQTKLTNVYTKLLTKINIQKQQSMEKVTRTQTPDYSQIKLNNRKQRENAFKMLSTSVEFEDTDTFIDHYKMIKSTDIADVPLKQLPQSKLHNYYITQILKPISQNEYKIVIIDMKNNRKLVNSYKNKIDCQTKLNSLKKELKIPEKCILINKQEISIQPELPYEFFTEEQKQYLDQLTKFAGRTQRSRVVSSQAKPSKKYTFIKNNFTLMTADEQYEFNDADLQLNEQSTVGSLLGFGVSVATMIYFIARKPLHAKLYGEMAKSFVLGLTVGQIYYQYHNYLYREKIHEMYVRLLVNKKLGKI